MQPPLTKKSTGLSLLGVSTILLGIILLLLKEWIPDFILSKIMVLGPNSLITPFWMEMPMTIPTDVYIFNWTNPNDFGNLSIKPNFQQVGPYRFLQHLKKTNVVWNDNDTVTFNQMRYWHFDDKFANRNLEDKITSINAITLSASHHMRNWNYVFKKAVSVLFATIAPNVYISRTVNQFLFDGYDDMVVDLANYLPFIASEIPRFDKFGWFRLMNGSETFEGIYNMETGVDRSFEIRNWNYNNKTPYFNGTCAKVHGTGGELYSAKPRKDHIGLFISHLCRYLKLEFEEEVMVDGILGYKYSIGDGVLDNGTKIPENKCFCAGDCIPSGMIDVSSCRYGTPTYSSLPNFYKADPIYLDDIKGLTPNKEKHETYIVLEPNTALPLRAVVRLQLNVLVHPVEGISVYQDARRMFFPLLWIEQDVTLPGDVTALLRVILNMPYIIIMISAAWIIIGIYVLPKVSVKLMVTSLYKKIRKKNRCVYMQNNMNHK